MNFNIAIGIIISLLFISLVIIFCAVIIKLYIKKTREHGLKEVQFQQTLNQTIIETQEHVFENISNDLHDDIGQQLTFLNFQLEKTKLGLKEKNTELDELSKSLFSVSQSIRSMSHSLNNQLVMQNDLFVAINNEISRINRYKKIKLELHKEWTNKKVLSDTEKIFLFRIFQEVISNVLKHAEATKINIQIKDNPHFKMQINDNGKGFEIKNTDQLSSLGLSNIKKRAGLINLMVTITSELNKGTQITLFEKDENQS